MKLTIKSNGNINDTTVKRFPDGTIYAIEIDFTQAETWADFELWLTDDKQLHDYERIYLTENKQMKFSNWRVKQ